MDDMNMLDGTVDEVIARIERCDDPLVLDQARREELAGKSRANVVRALNLRMADLPDPEPADPRPLEPWEIERGYTIGGTVVENIPARFEDIPSTADRLNTDWPIGEDPRRMSTPVNLSAHVEQVLVVQAVDPVDGLVTDESRGEWLTWTRVETPLPEPGSAAWEDIDRRVDEWHASADTRPVHEYLGITLDQYARWVEYRKPDPLAATQRIAAGPERLDLSEPDARRLADAVAELRLPLVDAIGGGRKYIPGGQMDRRIIACTDPGQIKQAIEQEEARKSRARKPLLAALLARLAALLGGTVTEEARAMVDATRRATEDANGSTDVPAICRGVDAAAGIRAEHLRSGGGDAAPVDESAPVGRCQAGWLPLDDCTQFPDEQDGEPTFFQKLATFHRDHPDAFAGDTDAQLAAMRGKETLEETITDAGARIITEHPDGSLTARYKDARGTLAGIRPIVATPMDTTSPVEATTTGWNRPGEVQGALADAWDVKPLSAFQPGDIGEAINTLTCGLNPASKGVIFQAVEGTSRKGIVEGIRSLTPLPTDPPSGYRWAGEWQTTPPDENDLREWYMGDGEDLRTSEGVVYFWRAGDACRPVERIVDEPRTVPPPFWQSYLVFPLDQCIQRLADDHALLLDVIAHRDGYEELVDALVIECQQDDREWLRRALVRRAGDVRPRGTLKTNYAAIDALMAFGWDPTTDPEEWLEQQVVADSLREDLASAERRLSDTIIDRVALREQVQRLEQQNVHLVERVKRYSMEVVLAGSVGSERPPSPSRSGNRIFNQTLAGVAAIPPEQRAAAVPCMTDLYTLIDELHRAEADARAMRMKLRLAGVTLEDR